MITQALFPNWPSYSSGESPGKSGMVAYFFYRNRNYSCDAYPQWASLGQEISQIWRIPCVPSLSLAL
jgi:hypothetical protein